MNGNSLGIHSLFTQKYLGVVCSADREITLIDFGYLFHYHNSVGIQIKMYRYIKVRCTVYAGADWTTTDKMVRNSNSKFYL